LIQDAGLLVLTGASYCRHRHRKAFKLHVANRRATKVQSYIRMYLTRSAFRRRTELGKRQAQRAAELARRSAAATKIQSHVRRRKAQRLLQEKKAEAAKWVEAEEKRRWLEFQVCHLSTRLTAPLALGV
jgi:IQ calmodulin-binding motif